MGLRILKICGGPVQTIEVISKDKSIASKETSFLLFLLPHCGDNGANGIWSLEFLATQVKILRCSQRRIP